jgi:hypothetical protein
VRCRALERREARTVMKEDDGSREGAELSRAESDASRMASRCERESDALTGRLEGPGGEDSPGEQEASFRRILSTARSASSAILPSVRVFFLRMRSCSLLLARSPDPD